MSKRIRRKSHNQDQSKTKKSKRAFTLLELLVSIALISIASSLLTMQGISFFRSKTLGYCKDTCSSFLSFCKLSALIRKEDLLCHLYQEEKGLTLELSPYFSKEGRKVLYKKTFLPNVTFSFEGKKSCSILFAPSGAIEPEGIIRLEQKGKVETLSFGCTKNLK